MLKAIAAATEQDRPAAKRVHEVRTCCKKLRGLLRIVRPRLGDVYRQENAFFRDAARKLSAARDAAVVLNLFDDVMLNVGADRNSIGGLRSAIERRMSPPGDCVGVDALKSVAASMETHLPNPEKWPVEATGFRALGDGLAETYQSGRRAMRRALRTGDAVDRHDWRKHTKYHWYHVRLLRNVWKPMMESRRDELDRLADQLGNDHDLTVLAETASTLDAVNGETVRLLLERLDDRRSAIRSVARPLGQRIFAESPKVFAKRMRRYWKVWRCD